jgi:hypothetical protein
MSADGDRRSNLDHQPIQLDIAGMELVLNRFGRTSTSHQLSGQPYHRV